MNDVLFLTRMQKKILDEANADIASLTYENLGNLLSSIDCYEICNVTKGLMNNGLLSKFGFNNTNDEVIDANQSELINSIINEYTTCQYILNAVCNQTTIIIWAEESDNKTNNMFIRSFLNILKAMSAIMLFADLKKTEQFKLCFLNY